MTAEHLTRLRDEAIKQARLGRAFPAYQPLDEFQAWVSHRLVLRRCNPAISLPRGTEMPTLSKPVAPICVTRRTRN